MLKSTKHIRQAPAGQAGMSLIEIIIVIILIGITIVPISRLSMQNLRQGSETFAQNDAISDIQSIMEQIYSDYQASGLASNRGYDWVRTNWNNVTGTTVSGQFNYAVAISSEQTQNGVTYVEVTVTITGDEIDPITNTTWLAK